MPSLTSISGFFDSLGAPLKNVRWSWGARRRDGAVFLRGWEDQHFSDAQGEYVVVAHDTYSGQGAAHGWKERMDHIQRVRAGAPCFIIMCVARDPESVPRQIESFDTRQLLVASRLVLKNGWTCAEIVDRRSPMSLIDRSRVGSAQS